MGEFTVRFYLKQIEIDKFLQIHADSLPLMGGLLKLDFPVNQSGS
jgi:hypothetical protein